jgi:hypothetical protein
MKFLKHLNDGIISVFVAAIVVIFLSSPARVISRERTLGGQAHCCAQVLPEPHCDSIPGFTCPTSHSQCHLGDYCGGICEVCQGPFDGCHPCWNDIRCVNQANEQCIGE